MMRTVSHVFKKSLIGTQQFRRTFAASSVRKDMFEDGSEDSVFGQNIEQIVDLETHSKMLQEYNLQALDTQRLLVIQPYFRSGGFSRDNTRKEYILDETLGLVETLGWTVVDKVTMNVNEAAISHAKSTFFGSGQLENIKQIVDKIEGVSGGEDEDRKPSFISSVFISTFQLTPAQMSNIEEAVGKPVLDRYNIVLQIFKRHATTRESKLQVQLAEIPYLKSRLEGDHEIELLNKHSKARKGEEFFTKQRMTLLRREKRIRSELKEVIKHRATLRKQRIKLRVPSVAVVGYTNAGKTSLIKVSITFCDSKPKNGMY